MTDPRSTSETRRQTKPTLDPADAAELERIRNLRIAGRSSEALGPAQAYAARYPSNADAQSELGLALLILGRGGEALANLLQAARLGSEVSQHHHNLGFALQYMGRNSEAVGAFRKALALSPARCDSLERLGTLLSMLGERKEATDCFRRIAEIEPDTIRGRLNRARTMIEDERRENAKNLLADSLALHPDNAEANLLLATLLAEEGQFDQANPLLEKATRGEPEQAAAAYYDLAVSKRVTTDSMPLLQGMRGLLNVKQLSDLGRQRLHFGLGKALDDLGEYESAMRHFDEGNALAGKAARFDRAHFAGAVQRLINNTTREFLDAYRPLGSASERPVLILGMPRSGTTLVERILSSHPDVAGGGEMDFWNRTAKEFARQTAGGISASHVNAVAEDCQAALNEVSPTARRVTDKMPGNFLWIGLFHLIFPKGRIIHCRRHPVDTCLSNYFTNFTSPIPFSNDKGHLVLYFKSYRRLMAHWRAILPPEILLEVDYEALVAAPEPVTRRMIDFLGLVWNEACLRPQDNNSAIQTASMWQARQPTYRSSTERWRRYEPWLGELRQLLDGEEIPDPVTPLSSNAYVAAAQKMREMGRLDEALAALQEAVKTSPHDPVVYNDLGTVCLMTNRLEAALDCFERAIGLNPNFAAAHYNFGAALEQAGTPEAAIRSLRRALDLSPEMDHARARLKRLQASNSPSSASAG